VRSRRILAAGLSLALGSYLLAQEPPPPEEPQTAPAAPAAAPEEGAESTEPPAPDTIPEPSAPAPAPRKPRPHKPRSNQEQRDELQRRIDSLAPKGVFILIDTGLNRLYLMRDRCILRVAVCSTGSGRFLPDPPRNREWTFDTPKGEFRIQRKVVKPVWIKPDWAFIEDGEDLPHQSDDRLAPDELGDYAMDLGDGYLIHGTLYERSLGMSVTHGCIRLGAKDLDAVFHTVKIGTPVYIF
jgi:lipoprotein-anchoring transpeptidase ErfK/SrfK